MKQSWECTFLKLLPIWIQNDHQKRFHHWTSEVPASVLGQSSLDGTDWPCMLAFSSEVQWWNFFHPNFVFIPKSFEKVHSQLCSILLGLGKPNSQMWFLHLSQFWLIRRPWCSKSLDDLEISDKWQFIKVPRALPDILKFTGQMLCYH